MSRPISNVNSYYRGDSKSNDQISGYPNVVADAGGGLLNGRQTPLGGSPTKDINRVMRFGLNCQYNIISSSILQKHRT